MSEPKFKKFEIPPKLLDQLYELSGGPESYKGFILTYATEKGEPMIHTRCDCQVTEYGLKKALETFLTEVSEEAFEMNEEDQENT